MLGKLVTRFMYGRKRYQALFEKLHFISLYGMNMGSQGDSNTSGESSAISLVLNRYEKETNIIVFDVGANSGAFTNEVLSLQEKYSNSVHVFAFEPLHELNKKLITDFKGKPVTVINVGLGSKKERLPFFQNKISTLSSLYDTSVLYDNAEQEGYLLADISTIDSIMTEYKISFIHYLKIDVEGHEVNVLEGAANAIQNGAIAFIQFEFGKAAILSKTYMRDFFNMLSPRYEIFRILKDGLSNKISYNVRLEIFQTTNYLAILKSDG